MENIFILLGLSFDPVENDVNVITKAINDKENDWKRALNNPVKKARALENLNNLEQIKSVMLDSRARLEEAEKAKRLKKEKVAQLEKDIKVKLVAQVDLSKPAEIKRLLKKYTDYGFTEDDVKKIIKKQDSNNTEAIDLSKILTFDEGKKIQQALKDVGLQGKSLYDFLGVNKNQSADQLKNKAKKERQTILRKGDKNPEDTAKQTLYGLCETIFKDAASKQKYDNYTHITRHISVNELIEELALKEKRLTPEGKSLVLSEAIKNGADYVEIDSYINEYCQFRNFTLSETKVLCGLCKTENDPGSTICSKCSKNLQLICPACNNTNNNAASECGKCRFNLAKLPEAAKKLEDAKVHFSKKDYKLADKFIQEADILWPNNEEIKNLMKDIKEKLDYEKNSILELEELVAEKKYYTAKKQLIKYESENVALDAALVTRINNKIEELEKEVKVLETLDEASFLPRITKFLTEVRDSGDATRLISKYPPKAVTNLEYTTSKNSVSLSWSGENAADNSKYILVRRENSSPNYVSEGTVVYSGTDSVYIDTEVELNKSYYYSIFTERLEVYSSATRIDNPIVLVEELENIVSVSNDGKVEITWSENSLLSEVIVRVVESDSRPSTFSASTTRTSTRKDGIIIDGLKNDTNYWFKISAGYLINNKIYYSEGSVLTATPILPVRAINDLRISNKGSNYVAEWTSNEWDFLLLKSKVKPEYSAGLVYDYNSISNKYSKVTIENKSSDTCVFDIEEVGNLYIIPCSIKGNSAVLGDFKVVSSIPTPKNPSYDLDFNNKELYVNFDWNKKINNALLVYRTDKYPEGPDDPVANRIAFNKNQYQANEGMVITNPEVGILYASIYHFVVEDGKEAYSGNLDIMMSNEPQKEILYSFKYKKPGFFSKKSSLSIILKSPSKTIFPNFIVVSKIGGSPLRKNDGSMVFSTSESIEINGEHVITADNVVLASGSNLKLFFVNDKNYKLFRLNCESGNKI